MKKKLIIGLTIMISIIMIAIIAVIPIERNDKTGAKWMGEVEDSRLITDLSIPGTHDSGATHSIFDVAGKCQDTSIIPSCTVFINDIRKLTVKLRE